MLVLMVRGSRYAVLMAEIRVNRAPFLTLWATVVARRLGHDEDTSLTLGRAVAGLTAQSKGRRLGIYTPSSDEAREALREQRAEAGAETVTMMGCAIPCVQTTEGLRALNKASPIDPATVRKYMLGRFKEQLPLVEGKLVQLAEAVDPAELDRTAMNLYMRLRPQVPKGHEGWGKIGVLNMRTLEELIRGSRGLQTRPRR